MNKKNQKPKSDKMIEAVQKELSERIKQQELKSLTWKLFWKYKTYELGIIVIIGMIVSVIWVWWDVINKFFLDNANFFENTLPLILLVIIVVFVFVFVNWKVAHENACEKLGIEYNNTFEL